MESIYLIIALVALSPFVALIALIQASGARRSIDALQRKVDRALEELRALQTGATPQTAPPEPPLAQAARTQEPAPSGQAARVQSPAAPDEPTLEQTAAEPATPEPAAAAPQGPAAPAPPPAPAPTLEEQLGTRWAVWVGGLALALGAILLVRYSIEQGIFGPAVRVALGAAFSLALVAAGEWLRRSEHASPIETIPTAHIPGILTAAGTIGAFGTAYAAHALHQFIGPAAAFAILGAIAIATMLAAALHGPALAGLGIVGALVVPLLIASQEPNPWPVVLYLLVVAATAYALSRLRRWLWLASATVAGAVLWSFAMLASIGAGPPAAWESALFVHTGLQLALAAAFMAIAPHLTAADPAAEPDWIAGLALTALAILAIRALDATPTHEQWTLFAAVVPAILGLTAWLSAPAAAAAVLAGIVALAALALWPAPSTQPEPGLLALATEGVARLRQVLRRPENVPGFLAFAALAPLAIGALASLRVWRGRTLPTATAGLYILAAVVPPLLALVLAWLRVTQFDRSLPFALVAVVLAAILYLVANRFGRIAEPERTAATGLARGAFASGVAAALSLGLVMALDRGYLTVAFALTAFATAIVAVTGRIPLLRYVVAAIGLIVLGRLAWDPRIMGADIGTWPILNWLLLGYGVPALAFLGAGRVLEREAHDLATRLCDALGVLFAALLLFFQIRHALNGGDPFAATSGHVEQGLFALTSLGFAAVLVRVDRARANPVFRAASLVLGVASAGVILLGLGLGENPLFAGDPVLGPVVLSSLTLAYLLPALAAFVLARVARGMRPEWYVNGATALGLILLFGWVALELRHAFQGASLSLLRGTTAPELGLLTLASLAFAAALIRIDPAGADPALRAAAPLFIGFAAAVILLGLGVVENPLLENDRVSGPVLFNSLVPAYVVPALGAIVLARIARGVRPAGYATGAAAMALLLIFAWVTLEVRHAFQGESLLLGRSTSAPEVWAYSVAWLALGLALLLYGLWRGSSEARTASAAPVVLSVLKVFLYDLTIIGGVWRAFSVIVLGVVLIGIGLVYQKLVFARPHAPPPA